MLAFHISTKFKNYRCSKRVWTFQITTRFTLLAVQNGCKHAKSPPGSPMITHVQLLKKKAHILSSKSPPCSHISRCSIGMLEYQIPTRFTQFLAAQSTSPPGSYIQWMVYELSEEAATRASKKGLTWVSACKSGEKLNFRYQIVLSFETRSKKLSFWKMLWLVATLLSKPECF